MGQRFRCMGRVDEKPGATGLCRIPGNGDRALWAIGNSSEVANDYKRNENYESEQERKGDCEIGAL